MKCMGAIGYRAGAYALEAIECGQTVGVRSYPTATGTAAYCARHEANVRRRFPEVDPPEPRWLHEEFAPESADPVTQAKAYADWTEGELQEAFGR